MPGDSIPPVHGIRPPLPLSIDSNISDNWKLFKQKWQNYAIVAQLEKQSPAYCSALLLHTLGDDALRIYNGFDFQDTQRTVEEILDRFDRFAIGETNETYERFVFNNRSQEQDETFENFYAAIRSLIKSCNFCDRCLDSILRDRIVVGIRDPDTQTALLKERNLTLERAVDTCKSAENASAHGRALRPERIHKLTPYRQRRTKPPNPTSQKASHKRLVPQECKYCGRTHVMRKEECPAWGKMCTSCGKRNHFHKMCSTSRKQINMLASEDQGEDTSTSDEEWVNVVHEINAVQSTPQIKGKLLINNKEVTFQIDTGASVNILPQRYAAQRIYNPHHASCKCGTTL